MSKERIFNDVPKGDVDQLVKDFESQGCSCEKIKQTNGKYTVKATCPDK